jgi:hypothetical protein
MHADVYDLTNIYIIIFSEVHLYMIVLLAQNKIKEALEVLESLEGDLAQKCNDDTEMIHIKNKLLLNTENWTKAIEMSKSSLETK